MGQCDFNRKLKGDILDIEEQELQNITNGFDDMRFVKIFRHLFDLQEKAKVLQK